MTSYRLFTPELTELPCDMDGLPVEPVTGTFYSVLPSGKIDELTIKNRGEYSTVRASEEVREKILTAIV